jgi:hypothetical protein
LRGGVGFAGMRMGRGTDKGDEFPPHGAPKAKDHDLTITPRIAARSGHLRRLRVKSGGDDWDDATAMSALPTTMRAADSGNQTDQQVPITPDPGADDAGQITEV